MTPGSSRPARRAELAAALAAVEERLAAACARAGRARSEVSLIAVTKTRPASDVAMLHELGVRDVGESKDQEAAAKAAELAALVPPVRWHFVGRLQRNKARSVARYAEAVHSVDRPALVAALAEGARRAERQLPVLVQLNLDPSPGAGAAAGRGGVAESGLARLADAVAAADGLRLRGVMGLAPLGAPPEPAFARLAAVAAALRRDHPDATWLSAGMSADLESAVAVGATHVRVGTALLGHRAPPSL